MPWLLPLPPRAGCVLWLARLDAPLAPQALAALSPDEQARAHRFAFAHDRQRFIAAHWALRLALGRHLGRQAAELHFVQGAHGKPALADAPACAFNMSHSGPAALIAIDACDGFLSPLSPPAHGAGANAAIGADLERLRPLPEALTLAHEHLHPQEYARIAALPAAQAPRAFLLGWTRKEACLKALGCGLDGPALPLPPLGLGPGACTVRITDCIPGMAGATGLLRLCSFALPSIGSVASLARIEADRKSPMNSGE